MTKAHEWAEEIKAWADGAVIQWRGRLGQVWVDFDEFKHQGPWGGNNDEWRVKPEPKKSWVRVAEHKDEHGTYGRIWWEKSVSNEVDIEGLDDFIRWLSPRFDFDYPEDYEGGA